MKHFPFILKIAASIYFVLFFLTMTSPYLWIPFSCLGLSIVLFSQAVTMQMVMAKNDLVDQLITVMAEALVKIETAVSKIIANKPQTTQLSSFMFPLSSTFIYTPTEDSRLNNMTLEQLEAEKKKAEKEENYEWAAKVQRRIDAMA